MKSGDNLGPGATTLQQKENYHHCYPKYPNPSKVPILRTPNTPAIQVPTPPLEGPWDP